MPPTAPRVLLLVWHWMNASGGIDTVNLALAKAIRAAGCDCVVLAVLDPESATRDGVDSLPLARAGTKPSFWYRRFGWRNKLRDWLQSQDAAFDITIHTHVNLLRLDTSHRKFGRHVLWAHGIEVWGWAGRRFAASIERMDRVVAVSDYTRQRLLDHGLKVHCETISNPIDTDYFQPGPSHLRRPEILIVGRMDSRERYKGHEELIEALQRLQKISPMRPSLRIVGAGDDRSRLERVARSLGVAADVRFEGPISRPELKRAYQECGVFALPSRVVRRWRGHWGGEGFGLVVGEALACGAPVLVGPEGGAAEMVGGPFCGQIAKRGDPQELAQLIRDILERSGRDHELAQKRHEHVHREFSLVRFRQRVGSLLARLSASPAAV